MNGDNPVSLLYKNVLRFRWAQSWVAYDNPPESMVCDKSWMTVISPDQYLGFSLSMISAAQNGDELSWHDICSFPRCPPLLIKALEMKMSLDTLLLPDHEGCLPLHLLRNLTPFRHSRFLNTFWKPGRHPRCNW